MNNENPPAEESTPSQTIGRRRFVRGAAVVIPVALTISPRSALSCTCTSVSAAASIALANSHNSTTDVGIACDGKSPAYWAGVSDWSKVSNKDDKFSTVFSSGPNLTMQQVLTSSDTAVTGLMKKFAAAYLNSKNGNVDTKFYTVDQLVDMWKQGPLGTYQPVAGAFWDMEKIKAYLVDTWN